MARNKKRLLIFSITMMRLQALLLWNARPGGMLLLWLALWHVGKHRQGEFRLNWLFPVRSSLKSFVNVDSICAFRYRAEVCLV